MIDLIIHTTLMLILAIGITAATIGITHGIQEWRRDIDRITQHTRARTRNGVESR